MVEVKYRDDRCEPARINARLAQGRDAYPLKPDASVTTNPTRCITNVYFGASQSDSDRGHGPVGPDPVAAAVASKGGVR